MTTISPRMKQLRQDLRYSITINNIWNDYKDGLLTKKEIMDSINMVLDDSNNPLLRYKMVSNLDKKRDS